MESDDDPHNASEDEKEDKTVFSIIFIEKFHSSMLQSLGQDEEGEGAHVSQL